MALDDPHARPAAQPGTDGPGERTTPLAGDEMLSCGRLLSQVWEQAQDATPAADPHTLSCPQCRAATEVLATVNTATRALRAENPPGLQLLADRVMTAVRAEARLERLLPLAGLEPDLRITERAAAKVLRQAADAVPGARVAACRLTPADENRGVRVSLTLAAALDRPLPERADHVRRSVLIAAGRDLDMAVATVDITVVDVLELLSPLGHAQPADDGA
ncbi:hypothetical protein [Streptomyces mexicanus]|jgi:hypothetical protein|uniref:hypothetical protein n=1 Tax=Streptomyces mexicanus TaxID=178566 RepID=UPI0036B520C0